MIKKLYTAVILTVMILSTNVTQAQFTKKMEFDLHWGVHNVASKILPLNDTSYQIGSTINGLANIDIWYNITNTLSAGINIGASIFDAHFSYNRNDENYDEFEATYPLSYSYHTTFGLAAKYYFLNKKKLKAYGKANLQYAYHFISQKSYYYVTNNSSSQDLIYFNTTDDSHLTKHTGLGAQLNVGLKTYFNNSFGMLFEGGYLNNGYYKGLTGTFGFFIDFIKN